MTFSDKSSKLILYAALFALAGSIVFVSNEANAGTTGAAKIVKLQASVKALTNHWVEVDIYAQENPPLWHIWGTTN